MKRTALNFTASVICLLAFSAVICGQNVERDGLRGVSGTRVLIEVLQPAEEQGGLSREQLQTDVELRLRKAGIHVYDESASSLLPYLYVNVHALKASNGEFFAVNIDIDLKRLGTFRAGNHVEYILASVWTDGKLGITNRGADFTKHIRDAVGDLVDRFINDYLAANPKP